MIHLTRHKQVRMLEIKARTMALYLESVKNDCARSDVERPLTKWQNTTLALHRVENLLYCSVWCVFTVFYYINTN